MSVLWNWGLMGALHLKGSQTTKKEIVPFLGEDQEMMG